MCSEHPKLGDHLVVELELAQVPAHAALIGDDRRVLGVGLSLAAVASAARFTATPGRYRTRWPRPSSNANTGAAGPSAIAGELARSVSTISREVRRNSGPNGYRAARAERLATARTARPRPGKLADQPVLRRYVEDKLTACWSPMQISRRLLVDHPDDESMRVSHETIYTSLFVQTKAVSGDCGAAP